MTSAEVLGRIARRYLAPRWKAAGAAAACVVAGAALNAGLLAALRVVVDWITSVRGVSSALLIGPAILAGLAVLRGLAFIGQAALVNRLGHGLVGDIQADLVGSFVRGDLARLRATHSGGFVSKVLFDAGLVRDAATTGLLNYVQNALTLAGVLAVMLWTDWALTLAALLSAPLIAWIMRDYSRKTTAAAKRAMNFNSSVTAQVMESLAGVRLIKMENMEAAEEGRVAATIGARQKHVIAGADAKAIAAPLSEMVSMLVIAVVIAYAGWRYQLGATQLGPFPIGRVTVGSFAAFLVSLMMAAQAVRQLASLQVGMIEGKAAAERLFEALDEQPTIVDAPGARPLPEGPSTIRVENVAFSYAEGQEVLDGLSFEARRGEIVALVGPSGGGKTTALNLIPRFYDVSGGRVAIDGVDVRQVTLASLRSRIALVTQEPFLFDDTVRANIAYAREGASQADVERAARQAAAHDFIAALPQGYETQVGEAGARLSGGQRQRIAIARAFLKNAPILLLDEATSALDTESESQVQAALERLMAGRTTIIIAHRLTTVRGADRIYVMDKGHVVEEGSHAALVHRGGLYARLAGEPGLDRAPEAAE
jgi:subfamily B ATP-binding cassette protein MsbA